MLPGVTAGAPGAWAVDRAECTTGRTGSCQSYGGAAGQAQGNGEPSATPGPCSLLYGWRGPERPKMSGRGAQRVLHPMGRGRGGGWEGPGLPYMCPPMEAGARGGGGIQVAAGPTPQRHKHAGPPAHQRCLALHPPRSAALRALACAPDAGCDGPREDFASLLIAVKHNPGDSGGHHCGRSRPHGHEPGRHAWRGLRLKHARAEGPAAPQRLSTGWPPHRLAPAQAAPRTGCPRTGCPQNRLPPAQVGPAQAVPRKGCPQNRLQAAVRAGGSLHAPVAALPDRRNCRTGCP